ncbi:aldehyde ferredoxin oxidoreductase [Thermanaerosceptrum fracticalcis]|uniref:Aldehyde ferredoxin oxidoreductase n=1 Tax=Thermanaerosceptrum fracticalcis TaxID=1712410 RepID=A0A7G6DZD5_THEFR|nr:aldehyde ferredoxin oxidoreductase C-terminal domain-containing protein [Thermanaerosceptrum fracticalcis]QNB45189.1 aldehyde ferredoxin oxidoreductase [Thermanaerosceptrum fracticalcis]
MLDRIIRVDMKNLNIAEEKIGHDYKQLAGRVLSSRLIYDEVLPYADPLGPHNKLIVTCGLLAGTTISCANRLSIGAKSPLTGGIKESNAGGIAAFKMGRLGVRAIILEGIREDNTWYILVVQKDKVFLQEASHLKDKGITEKAQVIYQEYGPRAGLILIGPAGEKRLLTAGIAINDADGVPGRFCGRGGLGAVMGAKHLLGIVLDDTGCRLEEPVVQELYKEKVKELHQNILTHPQTAEIFPKYGTAAMMEITNALGGLPTRNFFTGRFEAADKLNGAALYNTIRSRGGEGKTTHACMPGCIVRCSNIFADEKGSKIVSPLEYETICLLGSNLEIDDLDTVAQLNYLCNDYGVDTIEIGCAIGVAMEAGIIPFGDKGAVLNLMQEVVKDTYLGRIIASGSVIAGKVLGIRRVPAVKGQGMAAYEPRAIKGTAVTYITSAMGADHTAGNVARANIKHHLKDGQVVASRNAQIGVTILDALGFCMMVGPALKGRSILVELINARYGWDLTTEDLEKIARDNLSLERAFNEKAGFTKVHDRLPEHFYEEENPATGTVFDITEEDLAEMVF